MVPVRSFADGKTRLAPTLDDRSRANLARRCAEVVVTVRPDVDVFVVCDDPVTANWAEERGAIALHSARQGLNESLTCVVPDLMARTDAELFAVVHADLPLAHQVDRDVRELAASHSHPFAVVVTDDESDGTNVLVVDRRSFAVWPFAYGPGSCDRHVRIARELGLEPTVVHHPRLSLDLDRPADLERAEVREFLDAVMPSSTPSGPNQVIP